MEKKKNGYFCRHVRLLSLGYLGLPNKLNLIDCEYLINKQRII